MNHDIIMIPLDRIRILNPRLRDKKRFQKIVESIRNLGLKVPIEVSLRSTRSGEENGYDLICGQGRIEAFAALGYGEIPAIVVEASKNDRLLMSLVENMARRFPSPRELIDEIQRLRKQGDSNVEIGRKLDIEDGFVGGLMVLKNAGEERLLDAAISGRIPLGVAVEIARVEGIEMQQELLKAYENGQLTQLSIRAIKRIMEQRRLFGKVRKKDYGRKRTSADGLVYAFRKQGQRQKLMVRKARVCEATLLVIVQ